MEKQQDQQLAKDKSKNTSQHGERFPINQIIAALICNIGSIHMGMGVGWMSPALPQLLAPGNILSRMPKVEADVMASWLAALFPIGALSMTPFTAFVIDKCGRKKTGILTGLPYLINAILIIIADDIRLLLIGRFFMGMGASLSMANTPQYVGETASPSIRGRLGSFLTMAYTIGITMSYGIGGFISYKAAAIAMATMAIMGMVLFSLMPETPTYLFKIGKNIKAAESFAWLNRCSVDDLKVRDEMEKLTKSSLDNKPTLITTIKEIISQKQLRRGILFCITAAVFQGLMGMIAVHSYSVSIFMKSGAKNITPEAASLIYGTIQIFGAFSATSLNDKLGRKVLFALSSFGVSACMLTMSAYFTLQANGVDTECFTWVPVMALSMCVFIYMVGAGPVPFILLSDLLTDEVRSLGIMMCVQVMFGCIFLNLRFFGPIVAVFGAQTIFAFFGVSSSIAGIWSLVFLPETKGKNAEDIRTKLSR